LLLSRAPGREAYPGDIFYLHSRLLERSAKLSLKHMGGSLTALPIIETLDSDITAFIPTNVISITDGQIFTDEDLFLENIKPAVNVRLSVSRIGANAQTDPIKRVSKAFKQQLLNYERVKFFEIYDDLGPEISEQIHRGHRLLEVLKQGAFDPVKVETQLLLMSLAINGYFDNLQVMEVKNLKT
jgi:proton translocating ATP synthase F1 alpha subunit